MKDDCDHDWKYVGREYNHNMGSSYYDMLFVCEMCASAKKEVVRA